MFIKFNGRLYNMTNISTVIWFPRRKNEEDEKSDIKDYVIQFFDKNDEVIAGAYFLHNQEELWNKECYRIERWLLGKR